MAAFLAGGAGIKEAKKAVSGSGDSEKSKPTAAALNAAVNSTNPAYTNTKAIGATVLTQADPLKIKTSF